MSLRRAALLLCSLIPAWHVGSAARPAECGSADSRQTSTAATPLRTLDTVSFSKGGWFAWSQDSCDHDGNVFFLLVPEASRRDLQNSSAARFGTITRDVLGVSADGRKTTLFSPAGVPAFADAETVLTPGMAPDPGGGLDALVWTYRGETGHQYIVSFDKSGQYRSRVEVDQDEIVIRKFEVFGSGAFLLRGVRPDAHDEPGFRMAVMSASGGSLRDVAGLPIDALKEKSYLEASNQSDQMARGADGRIYYASEGGSSINVINASGESEPAFTLLPMPRNRRLVALKAAGPRLAATYWEEGTGDYDWSTTSPSVSAWPSMGPRRACPCATSTVEAGTGSRSSRTRKTS